MLGAFVGEAYRFVSHMFLTAGRERWGVRKCAEMRIVMDGMCGVLSTGQSPSPDPSTAETPTNTNNVPKATSDKVHLTSFPLLARYPRVADRQPTRTLFPDLCLSLLLRRRDQREKRQSGLPAGDRGRYRHSPRAGSFTVSGRLLFSLSVVPPHLHSHHGPYPPDEIVSSCQVVLLAIYPKFTEPLTGKDF